jgi:hypothetical protein
LPKKVYYLVNPNFYKDFFCCNLMEEEKETSDEGTESVEEAETSDEGTESVEEAETSDGGSSDALVEESVPAETTDEEESDSKD